MICRGCQEIYLGVRIRQQHLRHGLKNYHRRARILYFVGIVDSGFEGEFVSKHRECFLERCKFIILRRWLKLSWGLKNGRVATRPYSRLTKFYARKNHASKTGICDPGHNLNYIRITFVYFVFFFLLMQPERLFCIAHIDHSRSFGLICP